MQPFRDEFNRLIKGSKDHAIALGKIQRLLKTVLSEAEKQRRISRTSRDDVDLGDIPELLLKLAHESPSLDAFEYALTQWEDVLVNDMQKTEINRSYGKVDELIAIGKYLQAGKLLDKELENSKLDIARIASMHFLRGTLCKLTRELDCTLRNFEEAHRLAPENVRYLSELIKIYSFASDFGKIFNFRDAAVSGCSQARQATGNFQPILIYYNQLLEYFIVGNGSYILPEHGKIGNELLHCEKKFTEIRENAYFLLKGHGRNKFNCPCSNRRYPDPPSGAV